MNNVDKQVLKKKCKMSYTDKIDYLKSHGCEFDETRLELLKNSVGLGHIIYCYLNGFIDCFVEVLLRKELEDGS